MCVCENVVSNLGICAIDFDFSFGEEEDEEEQLLEIEMCSLMSGLFLLLLRFVLFPSPFLFLLFVQDIPSPPPHLI